MNDKNQKCLNRGRGVSLLCFVALSFVVVAAYAQTNASRFVGTLTSINGDTLAIKTDAGDVRQVQVPSTAVLKRVEPGQKNLNAAVPITLADLATGDRVLVRLDASSAATIPQATQIITIKQADVALKQQQEREAWQRSGVGGLVKSVDAPTGTIVLSSGAGVTAKTITVHVGKSTVLKRYAPASVRFDLAQPAPLNAIQPGDQLRARGTKNADGTELDADEIVSGSFRNISGIITSLDVANSTFDVRDLLTRKQVKIHVTPDVQMHTLPATMGRTLAARLKGGTSAAASGGAISSGSHPVGGQGGPSGVGQNHGANGNSDIQQILSRMPVIQFAELKKGSAVMVVATAGSDEVTAITLLTGVEPLLEAPEASRNLLSSWSMGSGEADAQ